MIIAGDKCGSNQRKVGERGKLDDTIGKKRGNISEKESNEKNQMIRNRTKVTGDY